MTAAKTSLEKQVWQLFYGEHQNTAQIGKSINMPEHEITRILHRMQQHAEQERKNGDE